MTTVMMVAGESLVVEIPGRTAAEGQCVLTNGLIPVAIAWLDQIRLSGHTTVPVPEAVLLGMLGLTAAGLALRRLT